VRFLRPPRPLRLARRTALILAASGLALTSGCLPLPDVRPPTEPLAAPYRVDPDAVPYVWRWVDGFDEPATPDRYDRQGTLRWALDEPADTVVVAVPGLFGGAAQFAPLARRLVATVPGLQVWAVDRRANQLEDRDAAAATLGDGDVERVIERYLGRDGRPPTYRPPDPAEHPYVRHWDLEVHLRDLDAVVREAVATAPRVVLLGHSLGASQAALYAAWRGGSGPRAMDGLVLIDGAPGRTGALGFERGLRVLGLPVVLPTRAALASGRATPWYSAGDGGAVHARRLGTALLAHLAPDATVAPGLSELPMSHLAFSGVEHDDQYGALQPFYASIGEALGAELDGNLGAVFVGGGWALRAASVVGVAAGADRIEWGPGDPRYERSDAREYFASWSIPQSDPSEWYMPTAFLLDLAAASPDLVDEPSFVPTREVTVPTLLVGSDRGLLRSADAFGGYVEQRLGSPVSVAILEGLTHLDLITADRNPVVPLLARWTTLLPR
jgi:alpha-beta hydrolase superfamily lysophospholipase